MQRTRTVENHCPHCGAMLNGVTGDGEPSVGDLTVCLYCARVLKFEEGLILRALTNEEKIEALTDPEVLRVVSAIKEHGPRDPGRRRHMAGEGLPAEVIHEQA